MDPVRVGAWPIGTNSGESVPNHVETYHYRDRYKSVKKGNIHTRIPADLSNEAFEVLVRNRNVKIERIVSKGHTSPDTGWYDQEQHEWVIVLKGNADISFENGPVISLEEGEYINIPAHKRHRVIRTSSIPETVWLAVHY